MSNLYSVLTYFYENSTQVYIIARICCIPSAFLYFVFTRWTLLSQNVRFFLNRYPMPCYKDPHSIFIYFLILSAATCNPYKCSLSFFSTQPVHVNIAAANTHRSGNRPKMAFVLLLNKNLMQTFSFLYTIIYL